MNCTENLREKNYYKEKIIERISNIEKLSVLQYLDRFIELFLKEWG